MTQASSSLTINKPAKVVYDFVVDGLNNPKWRAAVTDIALVAGVVGEVGATYKQGLARPGGRRIDGDYTLTALTPSSVINFTVIAGPARPQGSYRFVAEGDSTVVTFRLELEAKGLMRLMAPMIASQMKKEVDSLEDLKRVLEA